MALDTSNLSNYLKGITNAIRKKKGTTGAIQHNLIDEEIASIPTGFTNYIETSAFNFGLFNQSPITTTQLNQIDFSNYHFRSAHSMFWGARNVGYIPNIDTSKVTDFALFLYDCNRLYSVPNLDFSNGKNFYYTFGNVKNLNTIPESLINNFNSKSVVFTQSFLGCTNLKKINNFNIANAANARAMFYACSLLDNVDNFNCYNVSDISGMFYSCWNLQSISNFYTNSCKYFNCLFCYCNNLTDYPNSMSIDSGTYFNQMFFQCFNLTNIPDTLYYNNGQNFFQTFYGCYSLRNNLNITFCLDNNIDAARMFGNCQNIPVVNFIFPNNNICWDGDYCFENCYSLTEVNLGGGNCFGLSHTFSNCYNLQQIHNLTLASSNVAIFDAFYNCQSLHTIDTPLNSYGSGWMLNTFYQCKNLTNIRFIENQICTNLSFKWSPLLSSDSINSIVSGLKANVTNLTLTLNSNLKNNLTEEQIATITATKGWSIAYA